MVFKGIAAFDVFDEVDALMTPKKSFIYSVGSWDTLDEDMLRYENHELLLNLFCKYFETLYKEGYVVVNESQD